ncbi:hypothetical protein BJ165DRAFT_625247 [Panaeolus papilionaceus]|nr:hypothetical protein BJ165DRAFT_625247 [Panaeolus papilionaceus]
MEAIQEPSNTEELRVNFYPELFLQRRIWILDMLRKEGISKVLDVGCGEGQLLCTLAQPAPWLAPPPPSVLPPAPISPQPTDDTILSPSYNDDEIPNLHMTEIHGLDISDEDLQFAIESVKPPKQEDEVPNSPGHRFFHSSIQRWEDLTAKIWKGGLQAINDEFIDVECIVSTEVIEHLPSDVFPAFSAMLLGVYHPKYFLVTTPSYTFNARFTAPDAPSSARQGFLDPTGRTDRIFRHDDHKFEWTREEFASWCEESAKEWGYKVEYTTIGRAQQQDFWGRDAELGGASQVAMFTRSDDDSKWREEKGRAAIAALHLTAEPHKLLASFHHEATEAAMKPQSLEFIAQRVKGKMEEYRETFMRVEEMWFEREIADLCGGWIELLVRAIEESPDLNLKRDVGGVLKGQSMWKPVEDQDSKKHDWPEWGTNINPHNPWEAHGLGSATDWDGDESGVTTS